MKAKAPPPVKATAHFSLSAAGYRCGWRAGGPYEVMLAAPFACLLFRPASRPRYVAPAAQYFGVREAVAIAEVVDMCVLIHRRTHVEMRAPPLVIPFVPLGL